MYTKYEKFTRRTRTNNMVETARHYVYKERSCERTQTKNSKVYTNLTFEWSTARTRKTARKRGQERAKKDE